MPLYAVTKLSYKLSKSLVMTDTVTNTLANKVAGSDDPTNRWCPLKSELLVDGDVFIAVENDPSLRIAIVLWLLLDLGVENAKIQGIIEDGLGFMVMEVEDVPLTNGGSTTKLYMFIAAELGDLYERLAQLWIPMLEAAVAAQKENAPANTANKSPEQEAKAQGQNPAQQQQQGQT
ncbi:hypothetical protein MTO96_026260 [Rhipicephalus appendiculatus]